MQQRRKESRALRGLTGVLLVAAVGCGGASTHAQSASGPADPCSDFDLDVKKFWSAEVRAEVLGYGGSVAGSNTSETITRLDDITRDWTMLRTAVCQDHFRRKLITAEEYRAKVSCFDAQLSRQRSLVEQLREGAGATVDLEDPAACR